MTIKRIIIFSGIMLVLSGATLVIALTVLNSSVREMTAARNNRLASLALAEELRESSRSLTSSVQKFVVMGDERYADEYMDILEIRAGEKQRPWDREIAPGQTIALSELMEQVDYTESELSLLRQSAELSDRLVALEIEAMNARRGFYPDDGYAVAGDPDPEKAVALIFSPEYEARVNMIMEPFTLFKHELDVRLDGTVAEAQADYDRAMKVLWIILCAVIILFGANLLLVGMVIVRPVLICDRYAKQVAGGNLDSVLNYSSDNEIGSLASSLRFMLQSLLERINLEENMRYFSAVIASVDAGVIIKDKDGLILDWNAGAEAILGYKADEIIGKSTKSYASEGGYGFNEEIENRLRNGEHISHMEVVRKHKDGRTVDCSASYTPIYNDSGEYAGSVAIFHDVTEKKQIERDLHKAVRAAEEASKAKSSFLANMSHEIRTPMNGVIGYAELALGEEDVADSVKENLKKIKTSADSLLAVINDILDISKIEAGAMVLEKIPFDLHDIVADCEAICAAKAAEKGIALHFYSEPYVWRKLIGDPAKLRQALLNLMSNAIKFTNYGMVKLTALLEEEREGTARFLFEVKDSGIGMNSEQIGRIFDQFIQGDSSTTRKYGGTGLGLSITKSFIEMMGGTLSVESTPGLGSKFSFSLTFETSLKPTEAVYKKETPNIRKPVFRGTVLVCEDNLTNQDVIKRNLEQIGLTPIIAANGREGLDALSERMENGSGFDLILMDIHMPVMDGIEAMRKLSAMGVRTPVIALTANAMLTDKEKYLEMGMADYLSKPYTAQELWACLLKHLIPEKVDESFEASSDKADKDAQSKTRPLIVNDVLNEEEGVAKLSGDDAFYRRLQDNFYRENKSVAEVFGEAVKSGDIELAHRIAHSLKSSAYHIGAGKLARVAAETEFLLTGEKPECPSYQAKALESAVEEVLELLKKVTRKGESALEEASGILDAKTASELVEKLAPLLKSANPESLELIAEIKSSLFPLGGICGRLIRQMDNFDFDAAYETVCDIRNVIA